MAKILFLDRFGELNYMDVTSAYVSSFQKQTRLVVGSNGWDMPREDAEGLVRKLAGLEQDDLLDLTYLGNAQ